MKMFSAFVAAPRNALESRPPTTCRQPPSQGDWSNQICQSSASFAACRFSPVVNFAKYKEQDETLIINVCHRRREILRRHVLLRHRSWRLRVTKSSFPVRHG